MLLLDTDKTAKFCEDCRYYRPAYVTLIFSKKEIKGAGACVRFRSPVGAYGYASTARISHMCGQDGKLWAPKAETKRPWWRFWP